MFSYDNIQKFNDTEMAICKYIIANSDKIPFMTIRELAGELAYLHRRPYGFAIRSIATVILNSRKR